MKPAEVVDPVVDAAKHPFRTAAWSFGVLRGLAASVLRVASGQRGPATSGPVAAPHEEDVPPEEVPHVALVEPAPEREPEPPGEAFATEPTAVTRGSAHGGGGRDAEIDDWYGETDDQELPETVVEMLELGDALPPERR